MAFGLSLEEEARVCSRGRKWRREGLPGRRNGLNKGIAVGLVSPSLLGNRRPALSVIPDEVASAWLQNIWYWVDKQQRGIFGKLEVGF